MNTIIVSVVSLYEVTYRESDSSIEPLLRELENPSAKTILRGEAESETVALLRHTSAFIVKKPQYLSHIAQR